MLVSALRPAFRNPREADAERLELAGLSLRKRGFPLLAAATEGEILSGRQRHAADVDMQRPLHPGEPGEDAAKVFRLGGFAGRIIEG